jgi:hypothetical protein
MKSNNTWLWGLGVAVLGGGAWLLSSKKAKAAAAVEPPVNIVNVVEPHIIDVPVMPAPTPQPQHFSYDTEPRSSAARAQLEAFAAASAANRDQLAAIFADLATCLPGGVFNDRLSAFVPFGGSFILRLVFSYVGEIDLAATTLCIDRKRGVVR